ncbi:DUF4394 domain-containing protein [Tahibacter amnicola]|uniref:DUF4394 domain-containing protein n=1 Tax=Tahibacter amnicola TaxID=2976241 RepID=A0ABY6BER2_9GAMM|nr:DUF4394 domain-containing protein [Tahibacter amnicola]UXI67595.1 DUF4394 domain-containing protein [Tahibacter amnicola]
MARSADPIIAYAVNLRSRNLVSFDLATPALTTTIAPQARDIYAGDFFGGDFSRLHVIDNATSQLMTLDTTTGAESLVAALTRPPGTALWTGMAADAVSGRVYVTLIDESGETTTLATIDPATGAASVIGIVSPATLVIDIAASATGDLYGVDIDNDSLIRIDKRSGFATVIGPLGFDANFAQDLDFDERDNVLYMASHAGNGDGTLRRVDLGTGHATTIGRIGTSGQYDAFAIARAGVCTQDIDVPWLSISATAGVVGPGDSDSVTVQVDSAGLADGGHAATLCLRTSDAGRGLTPIPVYLHVGDNVFRDGFE